MSNWWRRFSAMPNGERHDSKPAVILEEQWALRARLAAEATDQRRRALRGEEPVVEEIAALLFREDPIGIALGPDDEYIGEAETIALWLPRAKDLEDVRSRVHETFVQWFDADTAGEPARYDSIAQAVLAMWQRHHPLTLVWPKLRASNRRSPAPAPPHRRRPDASPEDHGTVIGTGKTIAAIDRLALAPTGPR